MSSRSSSPSDTTHHSRPYLKSWQRQQTPRLAAPNRVGAHQTRRRSVTHGPAAPAPALFPRRQRSQLLSLLASSRREWRRTRRRSEPGRIGPGKLSRARRQPSSQLSSRRTSGHYPTAQGCTPPSATPPTPRLRPFRTAVRGKNPVSGRWTCGRCPLSTSQASSWRCISTMPP